MGGGEEGGEGERGKITRVQTSGGLDLPGFVIVQEPKSPFILLKPLGQDFVYSSNSLGALQLSP